MSVSEKTFFALFTVLHLCLGQPKDMAVKLAQTQDCRTLSDGIYSDPNDCHRYFHCSGSKTFYFRCYDGFVFDPCDFRCKMRDVCIPVEFCSKTLQNLTQNFLHHSAEGELDKSNDLTKLNQLQNDAEIRDPANTIGYGPDTDNVGRINGNADYAPWGTPYYPSPVTDERRINEGFDLRQYTPLPLPTTTEELRLAIVRSFNGIESASKPIFLNRTDMKQIRTNNPVIDTTAKSTMISAHSFPPLIPSKSNYTEYSHIYPTLSTASNQEFVSVSLNNSTTTAKGVTTKNDTREFAADFKDNSKSSSEFDQKKGSNRHVSTSTSASAQTSPADLTTMGTTEATMTYIVKVVFSRRHRPDSQKGDGEASEEGLANNNLTMTKSHSQNNTPEEVSSSPSGSNYTNNAARIKNVEPEVPKSNLTPLNNSLAIDMQKQGDTSTVQTNSTVKTEDFDQTTNAETRITTNQSTWQESSTTPFATTTSVKLNFTSETERTTETSAPEEETTTTAHWTTTTATEVSSDYEDNRSSTTTSPSSKTQHTSKTTSPTTKRRFEENSTSFHPKRTEDNSTSTTNSSIFETTYTRVTTEVITVTLSPAARLLNKSVQPEEKTVMSNISLACNPTISSALCEKSDNLTREALANHCQKLTCSNGGMYISLSNGHCGCVCPNGFKGDSCLDLVDRSMCNCANGGRCVEIANDTYTCRCPLGYLGNKCQYTIEDLHPKVSNLLDYPPLGPKLTNNKLTVDLNKYLLCMVNNCANGGICLKEIESGSSLCFCSHNFAGQYCEKKCINC